MPERPRTAIAGITLANWKGIFFQEYRLDGTVTALEGVNGAGKTTVMVAAFTALFPDQRWLDFENVAVSGKNKDRGIVGRLGQPGPAWAVLDVHPSHGGRCLVGVHLKRLADRKVQLEPFVVADVPAEVAVHELLLLRADEGQAQVPDPVELDQHLGRLGLGMRRLDPQAYFEELFELGVLSAPLRTQAERGRFFELLQTSLMGGLSDKVRRGLREYLLREDSSVAGAVKRMQANLMECRTTRERLERFERVHSRIGEVHDAGIEMFALGVHATRRRAEELELKASKAQVELEKWQRATVAARSAKKDADRARQQAATTRDDDRKAHAAAEEHVQRVAEAHRLTGERDQARARLDQAVQALAEAERALARDHALLETAEGEEQRARTAHGQVVSRKAAQATAWQEVSRKVGRYRQAMTALDAARQAHPGVLASDAQAARALLPDLRQTTHEQLVAIRDDIRARQRRLDRADHAAEAFSNTYDRLKRLLGRPVLTEQAHAAATTELERLDEWQRRVAELPLVQRNVRELEGQVRRQQAVTRGAASIAHPLGPLAREAEVRAALDADRAELASLGGRHEDLVDQRQGAVLAAGKVEARLPGLREDVRSRCVAREGAKALGIDPSSEALGGALREVDGLRDDLADALRQLKVKRTALEERRAALETPGRVRDPRLDDVASRVGGKPILDLLDDTPLDQAALIEARLGPDIDAIVVDEPAQAAQVVAALDDAPAQVILLPSLAVARATDTTPHAVIVEDVEGWRVTRLPAEPVVGEAARRQVVAQLGQEIRRLDQDEDERVLRMSELSTRRQRLVRLQAVAPWLDRDDPQPALDRAEQDLARAHQGQSRAKQALRDIEQQIDKLQTRRSALEALLPDAALLDQPDLPKELERAQAEAIQLGTWKAHLAEVEADRRTLRAELDSLSTLPIPEEERARLRQELETTKAREGQLDALDAALAVIDPDALGWADQEDVLAGKLALLESLKEEEKAAEQALARAGVHVSDAKRAHAASVEARAEARGEHTTATKDLGAIQRRLDELGVADASAEALADAEAHAEKAQRHATVADQRHTEAVEAATRAQSDFTTTVEHEEHAQREADRTFGEATPWTTRWRALEQAVADAGLLFSITTARWLQETDQEGGVNLSKRAIEVRKRLRLALREARESDDLLQRLDGQANGEEGSGRRYLDDWGEVRRWVLDRVPREVSESDDPSAALARFAERIDALRQTLIRGEKRLRTDAGEIARSIRGRYDRERRRLGKLNKDLAGAGFGSIEGMKVQLAWRDRMRRLLDSLQDQKTLFRTDLPLQEALAALYRAEGGGKVKGQRLLDYREYLDLDLQIRRRGQDRWVSSRDQGVSTGEAIGIGEAVLMVVLSAWEEDYRLARSRSGVRPLRFLFLDEASRLSPDSLSVLFELCRRMEIQMLVAAPYVPPQPGAVVYRLVRTLDDTGQDVVVSTGRRFVARREAERPPVEPQ